MHSNGLPGVFFHQGPILTHTVARQPVIAPSRAPAGAMRRALRNVGALSFCPIARVVSDRFGLFLVLHDKADELHNSYTAARERRLTY
jgi:hypothetical protein